MWRALFIMSIILAHASNALASDLCETLLSNAPKNEAKFDPILTSKKKIILQRDNPPHQGTKLGDLLTENGNMILFRVIDRPYQARFTDTRGSTHSHTLSPSVIRDHFENLKKVHDELGVILGKEKADGSTYFQRLRKAYDSYSPYVLISFHNLKSDKIVSDWIQKEKEFGGFVHDQLTLFTDNPAIFYELNVPFDKENVVAAIPTEAFLKILTKQSESFSLSAFLMDLTPFMEFVDASFPK